MSNMYIYIYTVVVPCKNECTTFHNPYSVKRRYININRNRLFLLHIDKNQYVLIYAQNKSCVKLILSNFI